MTKKKLTAQSRELHFLPDSTAAIRAESKEGVRYYVGYASVFNVRSKLIFDWDRVFYEIIKPGAFDEVLARENLDVPLVTDHERFKVLARTISGNLELFVDDTGLGIRARVPNTQLGNDTYELILSGDITDMSFRFNLEEGGSRWYKDNEGNLIHEVERVLDLLDVSILHVQGAYGETVIDTEVAQRMYNELIREDGTSDGDGDGEDPPEDPPPGDPEPTAEEIAEQEAIEADLDQASMELDIAQAKTTSINPN